MTQITWKNEKRKLSDLIPWPRNPRQIKGDQVRRLQESLTEFGQVEPICIGPGNELYNGHQRLKSWAAKFGDIEIDVRVSSRELTEKEREKLTVFLHKGAAGEWDFDTLANEFEIPDLIEWGFEPGELGLVDEAFTLGDEGNAAEEVEHKSLSDRFIVPPFSVLDARQGYWQERKRAWLALGIESELGRGECITCPGDTVTEPGLNYYRNRTNAAPGGSLRPAATLGKDGHTVRGDGKGRGLARCYGQDLMKGENGNFSRKDADKRSNLNNAPKKPDWATGTGTENMASGTSIFDPVLCELVYRWFCPSAGAILDPFAGGSVRGIVAAYLGHPYTGIDLRPEQIEANEQQAREILADKERPEPDSEFVRVKVSAAMARLLSNGCDPEYIKKVCHASCCDSSTSKPAPCWIVGDSRNLHSLVTEGDEYDLIFSCPPYFDLELYSEDEKDLSNAGEYSAFIEAYNDIVAQAVARLKNNRFACFVVGDIRDKQGFYRNFVSDTIRAFQDAGATLYNEAILVTAVGSLPIRVSKQFQGYRKLGKTHQNVLVFYKGDPRKIKEFGEVEVGEVEESPVIQDKTGDDRAEAA